jgi:glutathione S-transferase
MLRVHHLNNSRSQKTLWLLEELELVYEIVPYQRDAKTMMGPPEIKALHPMGKSPVLEEDGRLLFESGAICDYILTRYGAGRLQPRRESADYMRYVELLYFAVASGMNPILQTLHARSRGHGEGDDYLIAEMARVMSYIESKLEPGPWLLGELFTAADIQLSFVAELAHYLGPIERYPRMVEWLHLLTAREGFARSVQKGGVYEFAFGGDFPHPSR